MNTWVNVIAASTGFLAILLAWVANGWTRPKLWPKALPWPTEPAQLALVIGGSCGILGGEVGGWVNSFTTWLSGSAAADLWVDLAGIGIVAAIAIAIAAGLFKRVVNDKVYDSRTLTLGAALPAFAVAIPGSIGAAFLWLIGATATFVSWLMSLAF